MSRFVSAMTIICLLGIGAQFSVAQGPIRKAINELQLQKADYPGPIAYAPTDQDTRSKRLRLQTGHYGWFYNCDDEECKRNSPYICWNSQHKADWYCGWREALRRDRNDVIQRLLDGGCADCECQDCVGGQVHGTTSNLYGKAKEPATRESNSSLMAKVNQAKNDKVATTENRPVINAGLLGNRKSATNQAAAQPQRQAQKGKGLFRFR